jgi:hypothetical protein
MKKSTKSIIHQVSKRFQTSMIGSLARIEDNFGYLWGHNSDKPLTDKQKEFLDLWEYTRTSILNHGNNQMRDAIDEIMEYLEQNDPNAKYKITFIDPNYTDNRKDRK